MPGAPIKRATLALVQQRGGWGKVLERIADGETMSAIARDHNVSRSFFVGLVNADPARKALVQDLRREIADAVIDQTVEIADGVDGESREQIAKADLRIRVRQWLAMRYDPERYGDRKAGVTVNIGTPFLDALRRANVQELPALPAEIVEVEDGGTERGSWLPGGVGEPDEGGPAEATQQATPEPEGGGETSSADRVLQTQPQLEVSA